MQIQADLLKRQAAEILKSWEMPEDYIETVTEVMIDDHRFGL